MAGGSRVVLASALLAAAGMRAAAVPAPAPQFEWAVIAPEPAFNSGFLLIPDNSKAGPVFQCASASCGPAPVACTARVFPENLELWQDRTTADLFADSRLAFAAIFFFVEDDTERLVQALSLSMQANRIMSDGITRSVDAVQKAGAFDVILSDLFYADAATPAFRIATWLDGNRMHQVSCLVRPGAQASEAVLDFAGTH